MASSPARERADRSRGGPGRTVYVIEGEQEPAGRLDLPGSAAITAAFLTITAAFLTITYGIVVFGSGGQHVMRGIELLAVDGRGHSDRRRDEHRHDSETVEHAAKYDGC